MKLDGVLTRLMRSQTTRRATRRRPTIEKRLGRGRASRPPRADEGGSLRAGTAIWLPSWFRSRGKGSCPPPASISRASALEPGGGLHEVRRRRDRLERGERVARLVDGDLDCLRQGVAVRVELEGRP